MFAVFCWYANEHDLQPNGSSLCILVISMDLFQTAHAQAASFSSSKGTSRKVETTETNWLAKYTTFYVRKEHFLPSTSFRGFMIVKTFLFF